MAPRRIKIFQNYENKGVNVVKMRDYCEEYCEGVLQYRSFMDNEVMLLLPSGSHNSLQALALGLALANPLDNPPLTLAMCS